MPGEAFSAFPFSTTYGYVLKGDCSLNGRQLASGEYFALPCAEEGAAVSVGPGSVTTIFIRHGYVGQYVVGKVEEIGRVSYIDGCTDSLIVFPPRLGDPCLNSLHFPAGVDQSFHTHPSVRLGVVAGGCGISTVKRNPGAEAEEVPLEPGDLFMLVPHEIHRFRTSGSSMTIIAYHPDSDWGPTDETHPMRNRTYLR